MKLCFIQERKYAPYNKWFGSAFSELNIASRLLHVLKQLFNQTGWTEKEELLMQAYRIVAENHNKLKITEAIEIKITPFHSRPYLIINTQYFVEAIKEKIKTEELVKIKSSVSSINQISNETFILDDISSCKKIIDSLK